MNELLGYNDGRLILQYSSSTPNHKYTKPVNRVVVNLFLDGMLAALAAPLARWLCVPQEGLLHPLWFLTSGVLALLISGLPFHISQQYWRFSGVADLLNIAAAAIVSSFIFTTLLYLSGYPLPSKTFPIVYVLVLIILMGGGRLMYRLIMSDNIMLGSKHKQNILLLGDETNIDLFIRALKRDTKNFYKIIGLISSNENGKGHRIHNTPILGHAKELSTILETLEIKKQIPSILLITGGDYRGPQLRHLISIAEEKKIQVKRAPILTTLSPADSVELHPIALEELLNRPQVPLDQEGMGKMIKGKVVLVTGAGGSIGSELVRQISRFEPKLLVLLDHSEYALWKIGIELSEHNSIKSQLILGNIRDKIKIFSVFDQFRPELIFHAAALKHVPMIEHNPNEGFLTNIIGTRVVAKAALRVKAEALIMISTDKAVNPSSLMGASKRVAEMFCQALDTAITNQEMGFTQNSISTKKDMGLHCVTVRFGNVLGSTGSVVPLFQRQLSHGGPLTVTHPEMKRYFMTIPEAVGLVLQASVRATLYRGDLKQTDRMLNEGGIFVLDMGEPVKITDLARQLIRLAGLKPDEDITIQYTGLRPGEKLFEELFHGTEAPMPTDHDGLMMAVPRAVNLEFVNSHIDEIEKACLENNIDKAIKIVKKLVPEFHHKASFY
ncbi:hypothetical protein COMNV_01460 [Commensalibacter sp. Nvir]|nr:hypothetical protein COMNV_01460 [Commensalibacter sp. Nvir]